MQAFPCCRGRRGRGQGAAEYDDEEDSEDLDLKNLISLKKNLCKKNQYELLWDEDQPELQNMKRKSLFNITLADLDDKKRIQHSQISKLKNEILNNNPLLDYVSDTRKNSISS